MPRYHINAQGNPAVCRAAVGNCPYGADAPHGEFTSAQEARSWAEEVEKAHFDNSFGGTGLLQKATTEKDLRLSIPEALHSEAEIIDAEFAVAVETKTFLTPEQLGRRNNYVEKLTDHYRLQGESTNEKFATTREDGVAVYHTWRRKQQVELIKDFVENHARNVPRDGTAIFAGGLGGAGKGTVLAEQAGIDQSKYVTVNPDDVKELMAERGMIPQAGTLTPMETSTLVHEEASEIASEIAGLCQKRKVNLIYDGTMGSERSVLRKVKNLQRAGYGKIEAVFVSISPDTSLARGIDRYSQGVNAFIVGSNNIGGRPLPAHVVTDQEPNSSRFRSKNEENLVELHRKRIFTSPPRVFDNNTWGGPAKEIAYVDFAL